MTSLSLSSFAFAETDLGYWIGVLPRYQVGEAQNVSLQAEYREIKGNSTGLFRPAYHFNFSNYLVIGLGYDLFAQKVREQRVWPELAGHIPISNLGMIFDWRTRNEFRFKQGATKTGERTRIMIGAHFDWPSNEKYSLYLFNEFFFLSHDFNRQTTRFDRNWFGVRLRQHYKKNYFDYTAFLESSYKSTQNNIYGIFSVGWAL